MVSFQPATITKTEKDNYNVAKYFSSVSTWMMTIKQVSYNSSRRDHFAIFTV